MRPYTRYLRLALLLLAIVCYSPSWAAHQDAPEEPVYIRVVDVGAGLCTITRIPGNHFMIYDAGTYEDGGATCAEAIRELITDRAPIDLLVISHTDGDHVAAVPAIAREHPIRTALRPGIERETKVWKQAEAALRVEALTQGMQDVPLTDTEIPPGTEYKLGSAKATVLIGYGTPPTTWVLVDESERHNAGSIVVRLTYKDKSVLFTGDTVGRHIGDESNACRAAEARMVARADKFPLKSDVLIAPHHGSDGASSNCFLAAVAPSYVVFSAGHKFQHPRATVAERYLAHGVKLDHIFRTDLGDDEGGAEWSYGQVPGSAHRRGTNDVEILLRADGSVQVKYRSAPTNSHREQGISALDNFGALTN